MAKKVLDSTADLIIHSFIDIGGPNIAETYQGGIFERHAEQRSNQGEGKCWTAFLVRLIYNK